jgi:hypothetical protein
LQLQQEEAVSTGQCEDSLFKLQSEWSVLGRNVKPCAYEMSAAFLFYKKMPLPENELFEKNGNRIMTEAADCARICMKCITKI